MRLRVQHVAFVLLAISTACTPHYLALPPLPPGKSPSHAVAPEPNIEKRFSNTLKPLDDTNSVLYMQAFGGGGVALGLLLGPIGAAANAAAIGKQTDEDVALLKGKLPVDPPSLYRDAATEFRDLGIASAENGVRLSPRVLVVKTEKDNLLLGCTLTIDYGPSGQEWKGTYVYQTGLGYPKADIAARGLTPEQLTEVSAQLRSGFKALTALYLEDLKGRLPPGQDVKFKSEYLSPRFSIAVPGKELPGPADRFVVRGVGAMYSLPRAAVQVTVVQEETAKPAGASGS